MSLFKINGFTRLLISSAIVILTACGGGGGSDSPAASTPTLGGTAAVGYPIVGAVVKVTCATGAPLTSQATGSDGSWQVTLSGQSFPCAVQVTGGKINNVANTTPYHSIALTDGTVNVTPLTDLVMANLVRSSLLSSWFDALNSAILRAINATLVNNAVTLVKTQLNLVQLDSSINVMTTPFTPAAGNLMDDTLTALRMALSNAALTHPMLISQASAGDKFVAPSGFAAWIANSFIGTTSGAKIAGTTGGSTGTTINVTTGVAANGTPKFALSGCTHVVIQGFYMNCGVNSVANFTTISMVDAVDGKTCTASYNNGTLTVTKGTLSIAALLNGQGIDHVSTFGSGASETVATMGAVDATGFVTSGIATSTSSVVWNAAGVLKKIEGSISTASSTQQLSCSQP